MIEDPERKKMRRHAYYMAHWEEASQARNQWREANREKRNAQARAYHAIHREKDNARLRLYYASHREEARSYRAGLISLGGETVHVKHLPEELREVALKIKEARRLIAQQRQAKG
jgi:vacuolar-type H+-ATPase subunit I/STV1